MNRSPIKIPKLAKSFIKNRETVVWKGGLQDGQPCVNSGEAGVREAEYFRFVTSPFMQYACEGSKARIGALIKSHGLAHAFAIAANEMYLPSEVDGLTHGRAYNWVCWLASRDYRGRYSARKHNALGKVRWRYDAVIRSAHNTLWSAGFFKSRAPK